MATCSQLSRQSIVASIETGQLEHDNATVEELVGQLLVQERRENLNSGAAGLFVFLLVRCVCQQIRSSHASKCEEVGRAQKDHPARNDVSRIQEHKEEPGQLASVCSMKRAVTKACESGKAILNGVIIPKTLQRRR